MGIRFCSCLAVSACAGLTSVTRIPQVANPGIDVFPVYNVRIRH